MSLILDGSNGITFPNSSTQAVGFYGFKNRIINGAMVIDQRNAGASVTPTNGQYLVDRFQAGLTQASKFSAQQNAGSVTPPVGFTKYLGITSLSAYSVGSGDLFNIGQRIEGFNTADLGWGTANAKTVTLSFWVYSSLTGTFGGVLGNNTGTRSYPYSYTISATNTWQQISVTIAGDTTGTWDTSNAIGINVLWGLGVGSTYSATAGSWAAGNYVSATGATSVVGTNGATFYITGVQLEAGSTATSFDYRPYGTELALCQRYCINYSPAQQGSPANYRFASGFVNSTTTIQVFLSLPVPMRIKPTLTTTGTASDYAAYVAGSVIAATAIPAISSDSSYQTLAFSTASTGLTAGQGCQLVANNTTGYLLLSSEL